MKKERGTEKMGKAVECWIAVLVSDSFCDISNTGFPWRHKYYKFYLSILIAGSFKIGAVFSKSIKVY